MSQEMCANLPCEKAYKGIYDAITIFDAFHLMSILQSVASLDPHD